MPRRPKKVLRDSSVRFQLVPPYLHRTNAAELTIQTYKDHLIAGPSSCDPNFPLHLWDRLAPHDTLTLNLLRPSLLNPRLSAEAQLNGAFEFNRTPLAPPGTRVAIHEETRVRTQMAYLQMVEFTGKVSIDQTRCFPVTYSRGSKYLMVLYNHNSNAILAEPLTSRNEH